MEVRAITVVLVDDSKIKDYTLMIFNFDIIVVHIILQTLVIVVIMTNEYVHVLLGQI